MPVSPLTRLRDLATLLRVAALPLAAGASVLIAASLAPRSPLALLLLLAAVFSAIIASDAPESPELARAPLQRRLNELALLLPHEEALFRTIVSEPNAQRIAAAAFGVGFLRLTSYLANAVAALAALAMLVALMPLLIGPLAVSAALALALLLGMRLHDAIGARALAWLIPAAGERVIGVAEDLSRTRLRLSVARITQAIIEDQRARQRPAA